MNVRALAVVVVLAGAVAGCAPPADGAPGGRLGAEQEGQAELEARERAFLAALSARDAEAAAAHFTDEGMLHIANMPTIEGRPAIRQFYGNVFRSMQASDAEPDRMRLSSGSDMAWTSGRVSNAFDSDEGPVAYSGRYLLVWERRGGEWFIVVYSLIQQPGEGGMERPAASTAESTTERATGIGGVFFRARDPAALASWYREHLGVPVEEGQTYGMFTSPGSGDNTVWSAFPEDTDYFGPGSTPWMVNYRVRDLDAMLAQLRAAGVEVLDRTETYEFGKFGWALDPEGNRFELWEPTT
ncbi:hypothetical protein BH23GEM11_BH23GEM11_04530 [soil metagenome]